MDNHNEICSDEQIIELYWQRDEIAIHKTDAKYGKMIFRIAYNILYDKADCEECKNDTYLRIWNNIPPTRPLALAPYISKATRGIAIDRYKEKQCAKRIPSEFTVAFDDLCNTVCASDSPEAAWDSKEIARLINAYAKSLSDKQQYIFIGRFYFAETMEHIAATLGISTATVSREIAKIKIELKKHLERNGVYL